MIRLELENFLRLGLIWLLAGFWFFQAVLSGLYLWRIAPVSRLGIVLHAVIVLAALGAVVLICERLQRHGKVWRSHLAAIFISLVYLLICAVQGASHFAYSAWGGPMTLDLALGYVPQMSRLVEQSGLSEHTVWLTLAGLALVVVGVHLAMARPLRRACEAMRAPLLTLRNRSTSRYISCRQLVGFVLTCVVSTYAVTQSFWDRRELLHLFISGSASYTNLAPPELLLNMAVNATDAGLPCLPVTAGSHRSKPDVVLITVDALRADQMGIYGAVQANTPRLQGLHDAGWLQVYENVFSVCTSSFCGLAGLHSGRSFRDLTAPAHTLADVLACNGYQTHFALAGDHVNFYGLSTLYGSHIDNYEDESGRPNGVVNDDQFAADLIEALEFDANRPAFVAIHLMATHQAAYRHPQFNVWQPNASISSTKFAQRPVPQAIRNHYANGVLQADAYLADILESLGQKRDLDNSLVVITADHGENLGERDQWGHGGPPYASVTRIPLLVHHPRGIENWPQPGAISQADIAPSILADMGLPVPSTFSGRRAQSWKDSDVVWSEYAGWHARTGLVDGSVYQVVFESDCRRGKLFHLSHDPSGVNDIGGAAQSQRAFERLCAGIQDTPQDK